MRRVSLRPRQALHRDDRVWPAGCSSSGSLITAVFVICAIFAPWLAPYGFAQSSDHGVKFPKLGHPSSDHWFGTDRLFFDVLSRVIWGARTALEVVILVDLRLRRPRACPWAWCRASTAAGSTGSWC